MVMCVRVRADETGRLCHRSSMDDADDQIETDDTDATGEYEELDGDFDDGDFDDLAEVDALLRPFAALDGMALVTGGTGGIGSAVCRLLAAQGSDIAFTWRSDRNATDALIDELEALGVMVVTAQVDCTDAEGLATAISGIEDLGGVHTLVHAVGPPVPQTHLSRIEPSLMQHHLDTEVMAFFNAVVPSLPTLRMHHGSIVAVTSAATDRYAVRDGLSAAPKGAIEALVRGLAAEEGRFGVRANAVGPGMLGDGMAQTLIDDGHYSDEALAVITENIPLRRFGSAADVAAAVAFLASPAANYISGQILNVDGGYTA
jgi:3-oxoacyl-[acyl-carrier protein] reductase